ncbi:MAG TPA: hypothetical protein VFS43_42195 [Polyangiaceae bacterium]|nr:hypothetical protein [Polyangiaceae bacterium]
MRASAAWLALALLLPACDKGGAGPAPSGSSTAAGAAPPGPTSSGSRGTGPAPAGSASSAASAAARDALARAVDGAAFKPFFPAPGLDGTTEKVERAPKGGVMEVVYKKGKDEVATLVISDTATDPRVRDDYQGATERVGGHPLKTSGYFKSALLVADRYQVQITSPRVKAEGRKAWLEKVDLKGLAALK